MTTTTIKPMTGRRKTSVARVRLVAGAGQVKVNGRELEDYFPRETMRRIALRPLTVTERMGRYDVHATVSGGGLSGQAGALSLGIARALKQLEPETKAELGKQGLLTRDPRAVERKKYGQPGARKRFQFSKR
jgi:small subunit ribosomal protein S9